MRLSGRVVIITGAGSGIGRASALLLAREGAFVALVDRDAAGAEQTLAMLREGGGSGSVHVGDVGEAEFARAAAEAAVAKSGRRDVLMTAAGLRRPRRDAGNSIAQLPKREHDAPAWRAAIKGTCGRIGGRDLDLPATAIRIFGARLLALPFLLALFHRLQARRRATSSDADYAACLLAFAYTSIKVAIGGCGQRGSWCEEDG